MKNNLKAAVFLLAAHYILTEDPSSKRLGNSGLNLPTCGVKGMSNTELKSHSNRKNKRKKPKKRR